jgi:hypothetical protein
VSDPEVRLEALTHDIELEDVGPQQLVTIDGRTGVFIPIARPDPADPQSTDNLQVIVDVLARQVSALQRENAELRAKLADRPGRSADDIAAAVQRSVDVLQDRLTQMQNPVTNFGLREFSLQSKVHVDVTPVGTLDLQFVRPGEEVAPEALSTLSVTIVPVPKPQPEPGSPTPAPQPGPALAALGFDERAQHTLRASHVNTAGDLATLGTRVSATATLSAMLGIERDELADRIALAGLLTLPGVDLDRAAVLAAAGYRDTAAVAAANAGELAGRYADAAAARPDDHRGALVGDDLLDVNRHELAGLVDAVGRGRSVAAALLARAEERPALLAVVGSVGVDEAALRAVERHRPRCRYSASGPSVPTARPARMSVSFWTSSPVMTSSPVSCFLRSRLTSSARRMSILPWRIRRL